MLSSHLETHVIPPSKQTEKPRGDLKHIGKNMLRVEDPRLLTGKGRYIDDIVVPNMAHAAVLRSPHAHARIRSIDTSKAERLPGVVVVMTGADVALVTGRYRHSRARSWCSGASRSSACGMPARRSRPSLPKTGTSPKTRSN